MKEKLFFYPSCELIEYTNADVRWLAADELEIFNRHLAECNRSTMNQEKWDEIIQEGTVYCGLFVGDRMVARACVEKYSEDKWEVADVRTIKEYRNQGCAQAVCKFVMSEILRQQRIPTIRTREDNGAMLKVIELLGFIPL